MSDTPPKEQIIYQQQCEDFRSLNNIFWRVPLLAMTITGGIGFAIGTVSFNPVVQKALLYFIALCDIGFVIILWRLRVSVMDRLLTEICQFEGRKKDAYPYRVMAVFALILGLAAFFSIYAAWNYDQLIAPKHKEPIESSQHTSISHRQPLRCLPA